MQEKIYIDLSEHIASVHKGKKSFEWKFCKNIFTIELSEHIASVHEGKKAVQT